MHLNKFTEIIKIRKKYKLQLTFPNQTHQYFISTICTTLFFLTFHGVRTIGEISPHKTSESPLNNASQLTLILIILGNGCFVLAPPSIAIPRIGFVFLTVTLRLPSASWTTLGPSLSCPPPSPRASRCMDWCLRMPESPSRSACSSFMSKLRESLWANS